MAINWFEGGRRINSLISALVLLGGGAYVLFSGGENRIVMQTTEPSERFNWTLRECDYPDQEKVWGGKIEFKQGDPRTVVACFRANKDGKLWAGYGPEREIAMPPARDGTKPPPLKVREMLPVDTYSDAADAYMLSRMNAFKFAPQEMQKIGRDQWMIGWMRFWDRVKQAAPWVAGILFALWGVTTALGWIIRGFAGIPSGRDFKTVQSNQPAETQRGGQWIGGAIAGVVVLGAIAWAITAATNAAAPQIGGFASKILSGIGMILMMVLFFGCAFAGGWGLWLLGHRLLGRTQPDMPEKGWIAMTIINGILLALISWPINEYTIIGNWTDQVDRWSRSNGYTDAGSMALFSIFLLWPFLPLIAINKLWRPVANASAMPIEQAD